MVTRAAYLLFYRRRSEKSLGGPFFEQLFSKDAEVEAEADGTSAPTSRMHSPSQSAAGEGRRLDDFSRTGSSSAYRGAGAVHPAGGGGRAGAAAKSTSSPMASIQDDELPSYSDDLQHLDPQPLLGLNLDEPAASHPGAMVTWEGFGAIDRTVEEEEDGRSTGLSSTEAIRDDGESVRSSTSDRFAPGTPVDDDDDDAAALPGEHAPPEISISAVAMDDVPGVDLEDQPVAEVRLESEDGKGRAE